MLNISESGDGDIIDEAIALRLLASAMVARWTDEGKAKSNHGIFRQSQHCPSRAPTRQGYLSRILKSRMKHGIRSTMIHYTKNRAARRHGEVRNGAEQGPSHMNSSNQYQ